MGPLAAIDDKEDESVRRALARIAGAPNGMDKVFGHHRPHRPHPARLDHGQTRFVTPGINPENVVTKLKSPDPAILADLPAAGHHWLNRIRFVIVARQSGKDILHQIDGVFLHRELRVQA